jgi:riboflavin biosynthesis pyrimidine reductase
VQQIWPRTSSELNDAALLDVYRWPPDRRWLRANMVASIDGAVTGPDGQSGSIGTAGDKRVFRLLRTTCDVILVGAGTVTAERYRPVRLSDRLQDGRVGLGQLPTPKICIVTNSARLSPDLPLFGAGPSSGVVVATCQSADPARVAELSRRCEVLLVGDREVDLPALLAELADSGLTRQLTEGGPHLLGSVAGLMDDLCVTTSPLLVGGQMSSQPGRMMAGAELIDGRPARLAHLLIDNNTLLARWTFPSPVDP